MQDTFDEPNVMSISIAPLDTLPIEEYVSTSVISNLKLALEDYCPTLLEEGELSSCDMRDLTDPPLPKPRSWTQWSNDNKNGFELPIQVRM